MFVCLGNICRGTAAQGVLMHLDDSIQDDSMRHLRGVESSGLGSWHVGDLPDSRMRSAAKKRSIELKSKAQVFTAKHFKEFDYIMCADEVRIPLLKPCLTTCVNTDVFTWDRISTVM